jgi:hypothetical protein
MKRANACITLELELNEKSPDSLLEKLLKSDLLNPYTNRSLFAMEHSYDHEHGVKEYVEDDVVFPKDFQHNNLKDIVGTDFRQEISGYIIPFRLPSRSNKSGVSVWSFHEGHFIESLDSYYAGLFEPEIIRSEDFSFADKLFSPDDITNLHLNPAKSSTKSFSLYFRSTRRGVNTLEMDIVKNLPSVIRAKGVELVSYELDYVKVDADAKSITIKDDESKNEDDVDDVATSTIAAASITNVSSSTDSALTASNTVFDSQKMPGTLSLKEPPKLNDIDFDTTSTYGELPMSGIGSQAMVGLQVNTVVATSEQDTEIVMLSINVSVMKLLALHIVSFDTSGDPSKVVITNKDHLLVFHGDYMGLIEDQPKGTLHRKRKHNEIQPL